MTICSQARRPVIRCAVYTRKSSEEGLDQDFNSLDAQFEACAAYVASQKGKGWKLIPERYDDGGISGGTMERPGVQRLIGDIEAGRIDMIVVYKIDRLTRSLSDFAKLVDRLDAASCSFVSVTQAFNTSTSMGRLTLNVLLSFAQFEREVTGERIRDKIAASKKKGMWMGGMVPLGYDVDPDPAKRGLVINEAEAAHIAKIYRLYDRHECLRTVTAKAEAVGIRAKTRQFKSGQAYGGQPLGHGQIHFILTNPIYAGRIKHKAEIYDGQHAAIIDDALWQRVQAKLQAHAAKPRVRDSTTGKLREPHERSPLAGKLYDETGDRLTPSHTKSSSKAGSKRIRYYVSRRLMQAQSKDPSGWRLPALKLERAVSNAIAAHLAKHGDQLLREPDAIALYQVQRQVRELHARLLKRDETLLRALPNTITVSANTLAIELDRDALAKAIDVSPDALNEEALQIRSGFAVRRRGVEFKIITGQFEREPDQTLIKTIARAHQWLAEVRKGVSLAAIGRRHGWTDSPVRLRIRLAFLSPKITAAILDGRQPPELSVQYLLAHPIPLGWKAQDMALGFTPANFRK
ncbi:MULTISPECIES: recombinase family protein [Hyphobacterium]|uniref:Recombinase family protein n=1 Tax=Hyphobacterium vulgare TaxID=1736751 RepID=A0ABV6ZVU0_9PROT